MDEVADAAEDDSVVEVSQASGDDEAEASVGGPIAGAGPFGKEGERDDDGDEGEDDEEPSLSCADAKDGAGVEDEGELEEVGDGDVGFVVGDEVSEVGFGEDLGAVDVEWSVGDFGKGK